MTFGRLLPPENNLKAYGVTHEKNFACKVPVCKINTYTLFQPWQQMLLETSY